MPPGCPQNAPKVPGAPRHPSAHSRSGKGNGLTLLPAMNGPTANSASILAAPTTQKSPNKYQVNLTQQVNSTGTQENDQLTGLSMEQFGPQKAWFLAGNQTLPRKQVLPKNSFYQGKWNESFPTYSTYPAPKA